jgi:formylglycine-generating enzyme required for sulfatase activity
MSGGVWEWMSSIYAGYPYKADDAHEDIDSKAARVLRGGSWHNLPYRARAAYRHNLMPIRRQYSVGFRCVYSPE